MGSEKNLSVFLISLKEKTDLQKPFVDNIKNLNLIHGVDARENGFVYKEFGLKLDPPDKIAKIEFSKNKGQIGCYLSHYTIWKKILLENIKFALILEDDANVNDVCDVLDEDIIFNKLDTNKPTLLQLNKRTPIEQLPWWFDGTESYAINKSAAQVLLNNTHDFSALQNKFIEYAWTWPDLKRGAYGLFKKYANYDQKLDFTKKNTIRYAIDKFIGYCSLPYNCLENRLEIHVDNKISLIENNLSEIKRGKQVWEMNEAEIDEFENDDNYMWWDL